MNILIFGSGTLSDQLVPIFLNEGHEVRIIDSDPQILYDLSRKFDVDVSLMNSPIVEALPAAKILDSDIFLAVTDDDNTNILAAQAAQQIFGVSQVWCQINDPSLNQIYEDLGLYIINPTVALRDIILKRLTG